LLKKKGMTMVGESLHIFLIFSYVYSVFQNWRAKKKESTNWSTIVYTHNNDFKQSAIDIHNK